MTRLIKNSKDLVKTFSELCTTFDHFDWAIAWAGDAESFVPGSLLMKYDYKISHIVIGLHFYQTSPLFIKMFLSNSNVRFIKETCGTFHPKLYLFHNKDNSDWAAIIGSSNFTSHGFSKNTEANILLTSKDTSSEVFSDMLSFVHNCWIQAQQFDNYELADYELCWKKQKRVAASLSKSRTNRFSNRFETKVFDLKPWIEYENEIKNHHSYAYRINLLKTANKLFQKSFNKLDLIFRKRLAGCPSDEENQISDNPSESINWYLFGSMFGNGVFKHAIIEGNKYIGDAIDSIPLKGVITKEHYDLFLNKFKKAFPASKNPLASTTRLLALKRPDYFICVDGKNKSTLCKQFGIIQNHLTVESYWDLLLSRIYDSLWYSEASKKSELFPYRVAMLDCLHYD